MGMFSAGRKEQIRLSLSENSAEQCAKKNFNRLENMEV